MAQGDVRRALGLRRMRERVRVCWASQTQKTLGTVSCSTRSGVAQLRRRARIVLTMILADLQPARRSCRGRARAVECVRIARKLGDPPRLARNRSTVLASTWRRRSLPAPSSITSGALELFERAGDLVGQARCRNNIGIVYSSLGKWQRATGRADDVDCRCAERRGRTSGGHGGINLGVATYQVWQFDRAGSCSAKRSRSSRAEKSTERPLTRCTTRPSGSRARGGRIRA